MIKCFTDSIFKDEDHSRFKCHKEMNDTYFSLSLQVLVCDRTIKRGSWVSSLTRIDLALETMHTCSIQFKTAQKNSRKHLEEQKLEGRINSKSIKLKKEKDSCTVKPTPKHWCNRRSPVEPVLRIWPNRAVQRESRWKNLTALVKPTPLN